MVGRLTRAASPNLDFNVVSSAVDHLGTITRAESIETLMIWLEKKDVIGEGWHTVVCEKLRTLLERGGIQSFARTLGHCWREVAVVVCKNLRILLERGGTQSFAYKTKTANLHFPVLHTHTHKYSCRMIIVY